MGRTETSFQAGMSLSLEDLAKNTKALRETLEDFEKIMGHLERSMIIRVHNATTRTVRRVDHRHDHGAFKGVTPAEAIPPMTFDEFWSGSTGVLTGTNGSVTYAVDDEGTSFTVGWSNPWIGSNGSTLKVQGTNASWYSSSHIIPGGNTRVRARYIFGENSLTGKTEADWHPCGECKELYYRLDEGPCPGRFDPGNPPKMVNGRIVEIGRAPRYLPHVQGGWNYKLLQNTPGPDLQGGWRKCRNCKSLFYDGWENKGRCPDGNHEAEDPGREYFLRFNYPPGPWRQDSWRSCNKCQVLFYEPHNHEKACVAGGRHDPAGSFNYLVDIVPQ